MRRAAPVDGLTFLFLVGLAGVTLLFREQLPLWRSLLFRYVLWLGLLAVLASSSRWGATGKLTNIFHDFSPILFIVLIYESLGDLIQYLRPDIDPVLIRIDFALFGVHPTVWIERWITPWLTDLLSLAYISYYFIPFFLGAVLYAKGRTEDFYRVIFVLAFGYYLSFIGYILFPAIGPRYTLTHLQTVPLKATFITDFVRDILNAAEHNMRDCMPSGHTQMALMTLYLSHRCERILFWVLLPVVCGIVLSTVYLRYHYVIDLFAGTGAAIASLLIAPGLYRYWAGGSNSKS
jgi:membrane-associated phospholipid phosphatase